MQDLHTPPEEEQVRKQKDWESKEFLRKAWSYCYPREGTGRLLASTEPRCPFPPPLYGSYKRVRPHHPIGVEQRLPYVNFAIIIGPTLAVRIPTLDVAADAERRNDVREQRSHHRTDDPEHRRTAQRSRNRNAHRATRQPTLGLLSGLCAPHPTYCLFRTRWSGSIRVCP